MEVEMVDNQETEVVEEIENEPIENENEEATNEYEESDDVEDTEEDSEDELIVSLGEDSPPQEDEGKGLVKHLRNTIKEKSKREKELEDRLREYESVKQQNDLVLGDKPTIESCDFDESLFEQRVIEYHQKKAKIEQVQEQQRQKAQLQEQEWQNTLNNYNDKKSKLKVNDFEISEDFVKDTLNPTQQGILLDACNDPALVVYAIGKNKTVLDRLSKIQNPVKFAAEIARLESKDLKVTSKSRKPTTTPEKTLGGNGSKSGVSDSKLERLRAEAEKTGNYSMLLKYKKEMKGK